jgi:hypothetical protein
MKTTFGRRGLFDRSDVPPGTAAAYNFEEMAFLADGRPFPETPALPIATPKGFPPSKIGSVLISRLSCGALIGI